jgi:hypothetical protein
MEIGKIAIVQKFGAALAFATMVAGAGVMGTAAVEAAPVTLQFTFSVDHIDDGTNPSLFGGPIKIGDKFKASFTFDNTTPDQEPDPSTSFFIFSGGPTAFSLQTPNVLSSNEFFGMVTNDGPTGDEFTLYGYTPIYANGFDEGSMSLTITDPSHTWLSSDALPTSLSAIEHLAGVEAKFFFSASRLDAPYKINGHLVFDSPTDPPPAVPEPASLTLLGTGLLGLVKLRRDRRATNA